DVRARGRVKSNGGAGETASANASKKLFALIGMLSKPRHFRKCLVSVDRPKWPLKSGLMAEPTFYFERRKSSVALKAYCRKAKLKDGGLGQPCVRLEWSLKYKTAINRYLGGKQSKDFKLDDLLNADLNRFAKSNLRLEKADHGALGKLIFGASKTKKNMNRS